MEPWTGRHLLLRSGRDKMSARVRRHADTLAFLSKAKPSTCKAIIKGADKDLVNCFCECAHNILKGTVDLTKAQKTKLTRHKQGLRDIAKKSTTRKKKKEILQKGGFLPALLAPLLAPVIAPLAGKVIKKILQ